MRPISSLLCIFFLAGCASSPKCGNPDGALIIFDNEKSCKVRIRKVIIGSDLKLPRRYAGLNLAQYTLDWKDPEVVDGKIVLGHFQLVPIVSGETIEK